MNFKLLHDLKEIRNSERDEFYKHRLSVKGFNKMFDELYPNLTSLTFRDKYNHYFKETNETPEVWNALKIILVGKGEGVITFRTSISTHGRIWSHLTNKERNPSLDKDGYLGSIFDKIYSSIHRGVLTTFDLDNPAYSENKTVNHIDHIKTNNHLLNLEWMDGIDNVRESYSSNLSGRKSKPLKITVIKDKVGVKPGTIFYLPSRSYLYEFGINVTSFKERCRNSKLPFGCKIETVEESEVSDTQIPSDFIEFLKLKIPRL